MTLHHFLLEGFTGLTCAGSDVRILEKTGRTVSVTGIGSHELPWLDIETYAALLNTNDGKVILIMHEYAYYGRGNTIHSDTILPVISLFLLRSNYSMM